MTISDQTGKTWVTAFNDIAQPLLKGRTADELHELKEEGQVSSPSKMKMLYICSIGYRSFWSRKALFLPYCAVFSVGGGHSRGRAAVFWNRLLMVERT